MPTLDSDHNHYSFGRRRQDSQSSGYGASTQPTLDRLNPAPASASDHSLPLLPAYAYNQSSVRPSPDAVQYGESSVNSNLNGFTADKYRETNSPDPHDFYRRYRDPFVGESTDALEQPDMITARREHNMTAPRQQRRPSPVTTKPNGSKLTPLPSRIHTSYGSRNSSADSSPLASTKSASNLPTAGRNRQTSLKDLVNRFNQTPDEIPPLPRKSASRSTSTNSNPPTSTKHAKARTLSESKGAGVGTVAKGDLSRPEYPGKPVRLHQRRGRKGEGMDISPISATAMTVSHPIRPHPKAYASQSMTDLHPDHVPAVRKPLFGEILASGSDRGDLGYGILGPRRRRGSEGSMHSPNPMFPNERNHRTVSPSSPSAWYLGVTPTLEEIKTEKTIPTLPPKMHRRTRSDFTGIPHRPPSPVSPIAPVSSNSHPNSARTPISPRAYKRDSQSRIPISSRRLSLNSDSSNSTPSTRTNSALERHSGQFGVTKGFSAIPKPSHKPTSPILTSRPKPSRNSPRRGDFSPGQRAATSPRLAAYISAPLPKKSPPLRSSRPRLPVSSASTSASRARAVDRLVGQEGGSFKNGRDPYRSRKPPELGGVDFAARRQKIQQAFTKTVKENERQEVEAEKKRISMAQECPPPLQEELELETLGDQLGDHQLDDQSLHSESHDEPECEDFQTPAEELTRSERELTIQTGNLSERSVLNLSLEDSPTLGGYSHFPKLQRVSEGPATPPSDPEPSSAVTADTSGSVDTYFDNEPQEDPPSSYREHRTLLNHIMNMRDTSPKSPTSVRRSATADESASEKDDQESIKIMLGETPVLETAPYGEVAEDTAKDIDHDEQPASRWDLTSKTVSTRLKDNATLDERDAPMERIDENSPAKQTDAAHLSMSTASTNQTPQPWSPATFSSPLTNRTTMGSDTYSTINRVFDHYHDPNVVSPKLMNDVQQHMITQSPDLARQGGWDPKKVTQLYLQELARTRYAQSAVVPSALNPQSRKLVESDVSVSNHEKSLSSSIVHEKAEPPEVTHGAEAPAEKEHIPPRTQPDINDNTEYNPFRASLNVAADWDMSPSISDWIYLRAVDSPLDEKPALPPKDWKTPVELAAPASKFPVRPQVSRISSDFRPELPEIQSAGDGLGIGIGGLAINITEPQDDDSPTIIAPPLPKYLPPPPPAESEDRDFSTSTQAPSPPSPAIHPKHESLSSLTRAPAGDVNSKELHRQSNQTVSTQPATPVATSEDRQSMEMSSAASEAAKAAPPSPEQKRLTRRRHIIKELVDTEHSFGQDMKVVDDIYKGTSNVIIISAEDVKTLFGNSDQIVAFSTNFLDALKQAAKGVYVLAKSKRWRSDRTSSATTNSANTDDQSSISGGELTDEERDRKTFIGDAFGHHMANMEKIYGEYLKNHDAANQKLQILQKNQKVQIWLKECRAYAHDLTSAWDLDSLLVKPVQRILKYPLLLDQLLEVTPENHPDFTRLDVAAREMKGISMRINEMKKRADLMEQVANNNRKRKESDVRIGLAKAFGRRTEKLRQQVGLSEFVEDKVYAAVSERFGSHFFQLQVVMRDVEMYTSDVQIFMNRFNDFVLAIEAHIDVGQSSYPEVESKWRKFRMSTREISMTALTDHVTAVRKNVIEPMTTLLKLHDGPQKFMHKRNKRIADYARYKATKDRGEKPDKKLVEQGEQFMAINETLKDELPKLFSLTAKLVEACLNNFVQLQLQWQIIWRRKLSQAIDDCKVPKEAADIVVGFSGDFTFVEAQVLSLGICNGSMLVDAVNLANFLTPTTTLNGDGTSSPRGTSSLELSKRRTLSISSDKSPMLPQPDFGTRAFGLENGLQLTGALPSPNQVNPNQRMRASSAVSSQGPRTPELPGAYRSYGVTNTPASNPVRPITATNRTTTEPSLPATRQSLESSNVNRLGEEAIFLNRPASGSTYPQVSRSRPPSDSNFPQLAPNPQRASSPSARFSGFFSSAMPMSDSPPTESPTDAFGRREFNVIFLAASVYEFNIDRARREAGYPYLTYVAGEIFDVIGEKGELWLAKNQDDSTNQVGWIWNKHFVKLAS